MNAAPADAVVHVVDDDDAYRKSLLRLLEAKHYRTAAYASAEEFLAANVTGHGCILLDVRMPGMSGLQLQQALASRHGTPPIIFLTGHPSVPSAVTAMKGGAEDFLSKTVSGEDLQRRTWADPEGGREAQQLIAKHAGGKALFEAIDAALERSARRMVEEQGQADIKARYARLTPREQEVCALVVKGLLNKQIAFQLGTTERTVKAHRQQVMSKMGAATVQQLVTLTQRLEVKT
ncbi:MAG TPA: response regulator [Burkholderiales bacterium]|nr:response regulator [Burkholderiales bacterium]